MGRGKYIHLCDDWGKTSAFDIWVVKNGKGELKSGADLIADVITLVGNVKINGNLEVDDNGRLVFHGGGMVTDGDAVNALGIIYTNELNTEALYFGTTPQKVKYAPTEVHYLAGDGAKTDFF